ncbi:PEP/pyruvate-binding domain-containing protein [Frankia sp. CiP3]|uniref:PEP/pyruvate-binding domain-containing protein n=1 Tax=Frankia sp. CiP3 TaxID=2880971 RepID=UPI001EF6CF23|nr:PEP/pyruvate-binding domain-containing protein [Frankia sp. CiP3]
MILPTPLSFLVRELSAGHQLGAPGNLVSRWGGKAVGLAGLVRLGARIPATWLLSVDAAASVAAEGVQLPAEVARWAVRSSASVEDGARFSFAGQFRTELDLSPADVPEAVRRVVASATDRGPTAYLDRTGLGVPPRMAVVLQEYQEPTAAGVWIGRSAAAGRLEWCAGPGERLVSGAVVPVVEEWDREAGPAAPAGALASSTGAVGAACLSLQREAGMPLDLEFAVLTDTLLWLQARPVTRPLGPSGSGRRDTRAAAEGAANGAELLQGFAAAGGVARGTGAVLLDPHDGNWQPGGILIAPTTDPAWLPLMATAAGLVTASGGLLCHAAIVAREIGLPAVTGVGADVLTIADGRLLVVDGNAGIVTVKN